MSKVPSQACYKGRLSNTVSTTLSWRHASKHPARASSSQILTPRIFQGWMWQQHIRAGTYQRLIWTSVCVSSLQNLWFLLNVRSLCPAEFSLIGQSEPKRPKEREYKLSPRFPVAAKSDVPRSVAAWGVGVPYPRPFAVLQQPRSVQCQPKKQLFRPGINYFTGSFLCTRKEVSVVHNFLQVIYDFMIMTLIFLN